MEPSSATADDLRRRVRQQEVVADLGRRALEADDLDRLLADAAAAVAEALDVEYGEVLELRPAGDEFSLRQGVGWREGLVGSASVPNDRDAQAGLTLRRGEPVVVDDRRTDDRFRGDDRYADHDVVAGVTVVVGTAEAPWGVLGAHTADSREFTGPDATFVEGVANVLASAIENAETRDELARREHRRRALVEHFPDGAVTVVDADLRYTMVAGTPIAGGVPPGEDGEGRSIREAVPDDLADVLVPRYRAALRGEAGTFEIEHDGRHARVHVFPVRDDDGEVVAAMGVSRDVTGRERIQRRLHESQERFRSMMAQSPFSIQLFDAEGRTIAANPAWEQLWDAPREELEDYNILEDDQLEADGVLPHVRDAFAGEVVTLPVTRYDPAEIGKPGRERWIEGHAYPLLPGDDGAFEVALVHHDITDRKEREEELQRVRERMEFALTATDAVVWDWNVDEDRASFYPSAESLYGTAVEDWEDFLSVIHPEDRETVQRGIETALETGEPKYEEIRIVRDGEVRWIEAPGQPVEDDDGPTRMIGVARDITERKRSEQQLKESNERLEQFAHAASHDLQEPLRMVSSYLQLVEDRYADDLDEDGEEFIEYAVDGADRMREMIDSLLAYSRVETRGEPFAPVDLNDVLDDVLRDLELRIEESGADVTVGELPRVTGDADQLRELFQNLIDNAIEYRGDEPPAVEVTADRARGEWVVSVSDDGIGIDPAHHDTVFEVFERLHSREDHAGTGIGLSLCSRIVERHGGDIWVDSTPGEGATFHLTLPRRPTA